MVRTHWGLFILALGLLGSAWAALKEGKPIPPFETTLVDGRAISVIIEKGALVMQTKGTKGNERMRPKALILDFWATWCVPCHIASKQLAQIYQRYRQKGVVVLGISIDEDGRSSVVPFLKEHKTPYLVALDPKATVANRFRVEGLPTIYVVNGKGVIVTAIEGVPDDPTELSRAIEKALRKAGVR
jgi:thiol-disulfide isomerase/thioredoxin